MHPSEPRPPIAVDFVRTGDRVCTLAFARELMQCLGVDRLHLRVRPPAADQAHLAAEQARRIRRDVGALTGIPDSCLVTVPDFPAGALVVENVRDRHRPHLICLASMGERGLTVRALEAGRAASVLVPFGNGASAWQALRLDAAIARGSRLELLFYHTTWRIPGLAAEDPAAHMCPEAVAMQARLEMHATALAIPFQTVSECAADVAVGIVRAAVLHRSRLIVMPQSHAVEVGDYCHRVLDKSPVPVAVIGREAPL
jgi:hypothetical protein